MRSSLLSFRLVGKKLCVNKNEIPLSVSATFGMTGKVTNYTTGNNTPQTRTTYLRAVEDINSKAGRVKTEWDKLRSDQALMETVINQFK